MRRDDMDGEIRVGEGEFVNQLIFEGAVDGVPELAASGDY